MIDMTREAGQELVPEVLGLRSLSSPSGLLDGDLACHTTVCNKTVVV